jgi:hypothetical protein
MLSPPEGEKSWTRIVRNGFEKVCKEFSLSVEPLGFRRTLKTFWTRRRGHVIEFIHFHRFGISYGAPVDASVRIRVHLGIRVLNDDFPASALNGPNTDNARFRGPTGGRYHHRFNAQTGSTFQRCIDDLTRFMKFEGEPWFQRFASDEQLLNAPDSPLRIQDKDCLRAAMTGLADPARVAASLKLLGIKEET